MITRMMHVTMKFNPKSWAVWAEKAGVDTRCINFVLTYPEIAHGQQTTPRSLVHFFQSIENIKDFSTELPLIQMLGSSCLDEETTTSFITFIQQNLSELVTPEQTINTKNFSIQVHNHLKSIVQKEVLRVDIIATICTRLINYLTLNNIIINNDQLKNIQTFIKMDFIPNDIRLSLLQDLVSSKNTSLKAVMQDSEVALLLLNKM